MATDIATLAPHPTRAGVRTPRRTPAVGALITLARRRASLTGSNPRQILVPLLTPILFATVIAPALKKALGGLHTNIDYISFVSVGTVGLLVPLATTFAGLSVIIDRDSGAQRELLAAPIRRALLVFGNLAVVIAGGQDPPPGGVHRRHARDRDPAVVLRRRALPDRRAPRRHVRVREIASAHARDGVDALRARRSPRHRSARHLGDTQHDHIGVVEPRRGARVRRGLHRSGRSRFHPLGGEVMRTAEAATAG